MATQILPHSPVSSPSQLRAGVYARVSTNNGQDPTVQTRELEEYCQRRGWKVAAQYVDVGISGAKEKRPELSRLMADAHRRKFDAVIVWKFDRFARSVSHLLGALETFKSLGIEFVSLSEQVDTSTPLRPHSALGYRPPAPAAGNPYPPLSTVLQPWAVM